LANSSKAIKDIFVELTGWFGSKSKA
jgi:hypothetical protein